ncbi:oxygenase MpaB family protein [Saccharopolyspora thermophila]|nr:oxygenase MpaB family protein [Saccharopolyspora subtropica]
MTTAKLDAARRGLGSALFERVAGPDGAATRERIHTAPGPRWFAEDRPIRRVHGDAAMFVGGLRALLLQSLHPLAIAAVSAHSGYRGDPWGRLQRTSTFLAVTTFGTAHDAQRAVDRVRRIHAKVRGTAPDGRRYHAADPHLLEWVHVAEVDSFLRCHQRYGARRLSPAECDAYVADTARVAAALGVSDPPRSQADLTARLNAYRPELRSTREARSTARFLLLEPPLPLLARGPYALLAATAVAMLPAWARWPLRLPYLPLTEATTVHLAGRGVVGALRWALTAPPDQP